MRELLVEATVPFPEQGGDILRLPWPLADALFLARKRLGLDQESLAKRLGVSRATVSKWESGSPVTKHRLAPGLVTVLRESGALLGSDTSEPGVQPRAEPRTLSEALLLARRRLGLNQKGLAERLGLAESTLSNWENGKHRPTDHHARRALRELFGDADLASALHFA